jgi:hypothetical protein
LQQAESVRTTLLSSIQSIRIDLVTASGSSSTKQEHVFEPAGSISYMSEPGSNLCDENALERADRICAPEEESQECKAQLSSSRESPDILQARMGCTGGPGHMHIR